MSLPIPSAELHFLLCFQSYVCKVINAYYIWMEGNLSPQLLFIYLVCRIAE